jgi:hypothetical protein
MPVLESTIDLRDFLRTLLARATTALADEHVSLEDGVAIARNAAHAVLSLAEAIATSPAASRQ